MDDLLKVAFDGINIGEGRKSQYGHYIMFPMKFLGGTYMKYNRKGQIIKEQLPDFELPATAVASFVLPSVHSKTRTAGGAVRETAGLDDWRIKIRGVCFNDNSHPTHKTAWEQKEQLLKYLMLSDDIGIEGDEFAARDIYKVFVTHRNFPELPGYPEMFPFELTLESADPDEFLL